MATVVPGCGCCRVIAVHKEKENKMMKPRKLKDNIKLMKSCKYISNLFWTLPRVLRMTWWDSTLGRRPSQGGFARNHDPVVGAYVLSDLKKCCSRTSAPHTPNEWIGRFPAPHSKGVDWVVSGPTLKTSGLGRFRPHTKMGGLGLFKNKDGELLNSLILILKPWEIRYGLE